MSDITPDERLDASGLRCPLPLLKAKKALKAMPAGAVLEVVATDPGAVRDFAHFCEKTGDALLASGEDADRFVFLIRKGG